MQQRSYQPQVELNLPTAGVDTDLRAWLTSMAGDCQFLLAHADDGVIWGRVASGQLVTQPTSFDGVPHVRCPELDSTTLQQCRLFGSTTEVLLWRDATGWCARRITDAPGDALYVAYDEQQIMWGTIGLATKDGFTLVEDGNEGLRHAVPCAVPATAFRSDRGPLVRPLRLHVRHFVDYNADGVARIALSRLVDVTY